MLRCSKSSLVEKTGYRENGETRNKYSSNSYCYWHGGTPYYELRICLQLIIQKPFCELLNVKAFKRKTPTPSEVLSKKGVFKNFAKFTGKHLCWSLYLYFWRLLKSDSSTGVSLWSLRNFSGHLSCRHLRTAALAWILF